MADTITLTAKLIRPKAQTTFQFFRWDGTPVKAAKNRIDHGDGSRKAVTWWPALSKEGLTQADLAPYRWHEAIAHHQQHGGPVLISKGELKVDWAQAVGLQAISIHGWNDRLEAELLKLGRDAVLVPDCDLADLRDWYAKALEALPQARHLFTPGANWADPPEKDGVGLDDWLQINLDAVTPSTASDLLAAITDQSWQSPDDGGGDDRASRPQLLSGADLLLFVEGNYEIEWDELLQRPVVNGVTPKGEDQKLFYLDISNRFPGIKAKKDEARDALRYIAKQHPFNPVARYIEGLKEKASGGELQLLSLQEIAGRGFGLDDWLSQELLARKLVQQLKRGICPGYKADEMAIIQGGQGGYKTEAIQALCPEPAWCVTTSDVKDTEGWAFLLKLSQSWFYLLDECDKFLRGKDSSTLKSVITNRQDSYALKNLNDVDSFARPSTFWGTTNETELFNDHTGVRRWWLLKQGEGRRANPAWIRRNRDSIWATAYTWAMWGLESYLPRGSEVEKAAAARAWAATYELDGADRFCAVLNSRPLQPDGLPAPISQQALFMEAADVDLGRLWANNRKAAQDLIGDVKRTITSETFRTHDGQVRWVRGKRRLDGHPNPVQGFWPEQLMTAADPAADAAAAADAKDPAGFMPDPIPLVPICSDAVPTRRNGQTPWQNSDLRGLFQCSNQKEEKRKGDPVANLVVHEGLCSDQPPKKVGTLEQEPQIHSAAVDLPVPTPGTRSEQNTRGRNGGNGTPPPADGTPVPSPPAPATSSLEPSVSPTVPTPAQLAANAARSNLTAFQPGDRIYIAHQKLPAGRLHQAVVNKVINAQIHFDPPLTGLLNDPDDPDAGAWIPPHPIASISAANGLPELGAEAGNAQPTTSATSTWLPFDDDTDDDALVDTFIQRRLQQLHHQREAAA